MTIPNVPFRMTEEIIEKRKNIYHPPLPRKKIRTKSPRGRSNKPHVFTEEEIFIYKMKQLKTIESF